MKRAAIVLVLASSTAHAADLAVHSAPFTPRTPSLRMRTAQATPPQGETAPATVPTAEAPASSATRTLEERVVFKVAAGLALEGSPTSGTAMPNGVTPGDLPGDIATGPQPLRTTNTYLMGDAILGSRGVPNPALNTYLSSQFRLGIEGTSAYATRNDVWDSQNDNDLLLYSAYAEIDDWGQEGDPLHPLFVRAGRQFHYGSALFATQFDGLQLAWEAADWEVGGWFGRRVALFQGDDPGLMGGATARVRLERLVGWPVALALDLMNFDGDRTYVETGARIVFGDARVYLSARALDNGDEDGFGVGRLSARVRVPLSAKLMLQADGDVIRAAEVAYDYLSPNPVDVINLSSSGIALALPEPADAIRLGGGLDFALSTSLEAYGFARANVAEPNGLDSTWVEVGGALESNLGTGWAVGAQLKLRRHSLDDDANSLDGDFGDMRGAGVTGFQEASAELRYRRGYRELGAAAGAWVRVYDFVGPYSEIIGDSRAGGRLDGDYWFNKHARVRAIAELAQPSTALAEDLDTQYSIRFLGEANF
jgi:hypothetical protein